jgi:peptidoglycan-N-acetylglucosamine deacetylase
MRKRAVALLTICVVLVVGLYFGLKQLRYAADGLRNGLSPSYWIDRMNGKDLYNAQSRWLKRGNRAYHEVLLTFDDGPHPGSAERIMSALKSQNIPATFFVVGKQVKLHPELVKQMIDQGFEVGNHTQDHLRLDKLRPDQIYNEIHNCEINVQRACGRGMRLFRPPGMRQSDDMITQTLKAGYTIIGENVGAKDFVPDQQITDMSARQTKELSTTSSEDISQRVLKQIKDGVIILLHDDPATADALPAIISGLKAQGYGFASSTKFLAQLPHPVQIVANPPGAIDLSKLPKPKPAAPPPKVKPAATTKTSVS